MADRQVEFVGELQPNHPILRLIIDNQVGNFIPSIEEMNFDAAKKKEICRNKWIISRADAYGQAMNVVRVGPKFYKTTVDTGILGILFPANHPEIEFKLILIRNWSYV
ncbi:unnamed protein product [Orchesella dallaii]|uniref:Uncharacterized protein n=1 Tax=Orchesella dallaii TaxID=48710 RepID=A0ABP1QZD9_9HEXA